MAASSGFDQSPGPPLLGNVCGIVPAHHRGHQNCQQSWFIFLLLCHLLLPGGCWGNTEQVVAQWRRPGGFPGSSEHAALGNAICIAPAHCRGHQNGQQQMFICFLLPLFCLP
jgi:hypothetical protein